MLRSLSLLLSACLLFSRPTSASNGIPAPREPRGVADYIRAGLGVTTTTTATFLETTVATLTEGQAAPTAANSTADDLAALATCAASWSAYNVSATTNIGYTYVTYATASIVNTTVVYGTGDVYTSYGKIPVASGEFTPTRTVHRMLNITTTTSSDISTTHNPALITETPACTFKAKDCSRLYVSYISSLGLPFNASVPKITPSPENSPQCPDYYYKPYTSTYFSTDLSLKPDCKLYGNSVELFYFPSRTDQPTTPVTYEYKPGTTFTSPSIYLSFDYISATRYIPLSVASYSISCGYSGCVTAGVGGGDEISSEGSVISGQILTMAPTDVSSIVLNYGSAKGSGVVSTVAGNLPGYGNAAADIHVGAVISQSLKAERLRIEDLVHPPPAAYYLRPEGAPGCGSKIHSPECGTIFEGAYRAIISLPSEVSLLQGAWATCNPAIYGVYDPPIALTEAASVAKPTLPAGYQTTTAAATAQPYTITPPLATAAATALRDSLPSATSAVSSNGGNGNGAQSEGGTSNDQSESGSQSSGSSNDESGAGTGSASNGQGQSGGQSGGSSSGEGQNGGQSGGSSNEQGQNGGQSGGSSNEQDQGSGQNGGSSNGQGQSGGSSGGSSNGENQNGDQTGSSSNGQGQGSGQTGAASSGTSDSDGDASSSDGTASGGGSEEITTTLYNSEGSATATSTSHRGGSSHKGSATAKTSSSRESTDTSSSTSPSESSQKGVAGRLSAPWSCCIGAIMMAVVL